MNNKTIYKYFENNGFCETMDFKTNFGDYKL